MSICNGLLAPHDQEVAMLPIKNELLAEMQSKTSISAHVSTVKYAIPTIA